MNMPAYVRNPHKWFQPGPFRTASSFSSPLFLDNFIRGKGGKWMDYERRFVDRLQLQTVSPIRARRIPLEADAWADRNPATPDHPFFGQRDTADLFWDYNALARSQRPGIDKDIPALTVHMQKYILLQIGLAREFDMRAEFVVDWTLKHANKTVGWKTIGHCIRQVAAFLRLVHIGEWDTGVDGNAIGHPTNEAANDKIGELFDRVRGPIAHLIAFELHNEFDAHSQRSWAKAGMSPEKALAEVNRQLERTKRLKDGKPEQWPEGACWVSHGGSDKIEYNPQYADAVAIHPSRPGTRVGDRFHGLRRHGKSVYANEIYHYIPRDLWWTVEQGWFRPGSSTQDMDKRFTFVDEMLADGIWVCEHGLTNMSNGRWKDADQDFEEMPLDPYELARGARNGNVHPPTPPDTWPPDDQSLRPYDHYVMAAYGEILLREKVGDAGRRAWNDALEDGLTVGAMRNEFMRSGEFKLKNDGPWNYVLADPIPTARPAHYIRWTCEVTAPTCEDRMDWSRKVELAYSVHRGHRDLGVLLTAEGARYLKDGDREVLDLTATDINAIIATMVTVDAEGTRLRHRIENEKHRVYDPNPAGEWHRSQVRKSRARDMISDLETQSDVYYAIAAKFPTDPNCDAITCKVNAWVAEDWPRPLI